MDNQEEVKDCETCRLRKRSAADPDCLKLVGPCVKGDKWEPVPKEEPDIVMEELNGCHNCVSSVDNKACTIIDDCIGSSKYVAKCCANCNFEISYSGRKCIEVIGDCHAQDKWDPRPDQVKPVDDTLTPDQAISLMVFKGEEVEARADGKWLTYRFHQKCGKFKVKTNFGNWEDTRRLHMQTAFRKPRVELSLADVWLHLGRGGSVIDSEGNVYHSQYYDDLNYWTVVLRFEQGRKYYEHEETGKYKSVMEG